MTEIKISKRKLIALVTAISILMLVAGFELREVLASPGPGITIWPDFIDMAALTSDPTLSEGRFWYRSDTDELKIAISDSESKEIQTEAYSFNLTEEIYDYDGIFWLEWFRSIDGYYTSTDGSASITLNRDNLEIDTGEELDSLAKLGTLRMRALSADPSWDKDRRVKIRVSIYLSSNQEIRLYVGPDVAPSVDDTDRHIGFKIENLTLYGTVADGTTENTLSLETLSTGSNDLTLECVFTAGSEARFYRNGVDEGALTSNLPAPDTYERGDGLVYVTVKTLSTSYDKVFLYAWYFLQEP